MKSIIEIVSRLSSSQQQTEKEIGFGGVLDIRCTRLNHKLCKWLIQNFDTRYCSLNVHGYQFFLIAEHIGDILGIHCKGCEVDFTGSLEKYPKLLEQLGAINGAIPLKGLREYLHETRDVGDEFKRKFALYILGALLCPTTKPSLKLEFVYAVKNVHIMGNCN